MRKLKKMLEATGLVLFIIIGISFVQTAIAETTATFTATCYMPYYVTLPDGQKVLAENQEDKQETILETQTQEDEKSYVSNSNPNLIQQQEEMTREDNSQTELITTVCAK